MKRTLVLVTVLGLGCGVALAQDRADVSKKIEQRVGHGLGPEAGRAEPALPPGVSLVDGLSEDEAIATALWNNAAFRRTLPISDLRAPTWWRPVCSAIRSCHSFFLLAQATRVHGHVAA